MKLDWTITSVQGAGNLGGLPESIGFGSGAMKFVDDWVLVDLEALPFPLALRAQRAPSGVLVCTSLYVERESSRPLTSRDLRSIPLGGILTGIQRAHEAVTHGIGVRFHGEPPRSAVGPPRRGRREISDDELEKFAADIRDARRVAGHKYVKHLAETLHWSPATIHRMRKRAEARGFQTDPEEER